jgi:hypothetical protein
MSSATLRLQWGDAPPVIRDPQLMNWQVPASPEPIGGSVAASCQGARFANLRLNLDNIGRNAASAAGRAPDDIAQLRAVGCRLVGDHAVMFTSVGLTDGTALQTVQEGVGQGNPDAFPGAEVYPVPRGREVTFPRHHRPTWVGDRDRVVDRTVLFCAPGGATAELVRRFADGATTVLAKAQLGKDGIGVATALHRIDATTGGSVQLSVVVRNGAGQEIETAPVGGDDPMGRQLDGPVDGA